MSTRRVSTFPCWCLMFNHWKLVLFGTLIWFTNFKISFFTSRKRTCARPSVCRIVRISSSSSTCRMLPKRRHTTFSSTVASIQVTLKETHQEPFGIAVRWRPVVTPLKSPSSRVRVSARASHRLFTAGPWMRPLSSYLTVSASRSVTAPRLTISFCRCTTHMFTDSCVRFFHNSN